jgi:hypothetical protein
VGKAESLLEVEVGDTREWAGELNLVEDQRCWTESLLVGSQRVCGARLLARRTVG